jgi:formylglycine-generating enzyme required for sulfatase activity
VLRPDRKPPWQKERLKLPSSSHNTPQRGFYRRKSFWLVTAGILAGVGLMLGARAGVQATSSDKFCDKTCHVHPSATETWIKSKHYATKSGVVTHCVDCHLPGTTGPEYYVEKARLGAQDLYGTVFKDTSQIDWVAKRSLDRAKTFTYESSCLRCHQNLFSAQLSKKGVDGHLHYQRSQGKLWCINCHLHTGHDRGKEAEEITGGDEARERELDNQFPTHPPGFQNYTDIIPGSDAKIRMVAIPAGTFEMGSPETEPYRRPDEGPMRQVRLSRFWMGRAEVSWREFDVYYARRGTGGRQEFARADAVTGPTPPYGSPDQGWGKGARPAITMTYHAATEYTKWLSEVTGKKFRLPTEAEWEYAARAGTKSPYFFAGDPKQFTERYWLNRFLGVKTVPIGEYVWYEANSGLRTHPPEDVKANAFGLVNMLGNVREFCLDWYAADAYAQYPPGEVVNPRGPATGEEHVVRGGSYRSDAADLRVAARDFTRTAEWLLTDPQVPKSIWWYSDSTDVGFRIVREFEEQASPDGSRIAAKK